MFSIFTTLQMYNFNTMFNLCNTMNNIWETSQATSLFQAKHNEEKER